MKQTIENIDKDKQLFTVPDKYFEELPMKIQKRIETPSKSRRIEVFSALRVAVAVSVVILFVFGLSKLDQQPSAEKMLAEVPESELLAYLEQIEIDEYDIAEVVGDDTDMLQLDEYNYLDGVQFEGLVIDDVLTEYDLDEEIQ